MATMSAPGSRQFSAKRGSSTDSYALRVRRTVLSAVTAGRTPAPEKPTTYIASWLLTTASAPAAGNALENRNP